METRDGLLVGGALAAFVLLGFVLLQSGSGGANALPSGALLSPHGQDSGAAGVDGVPIPTRDPVPKNPELQQVAVTVGDVGPQESAPAADSTTRLSRKDQHYSFLRRCGRAVSLELPSTLEIPSDLNQRLIRDVEPFMRRCDVIEDAYKSAIRRAAATKLANGGGEMASMDGRLNAKALQPQFEGQMVMVMNNRVFRFDPGENSELDAAQVALQSELVACATSYLPFIRTHVPSIDTEKKR